MKLLFRLAFRNVMRNRRRSSLTSLLIGMGLAAMMITDGLMVGMMDYMLKAGTGDFVGSVQIHAKNFRLEQDINLTVDRPHELLSILKETGGSAKWASRAVGFAMIASPRGSSNLALYGIVPSEEKKVTELLSLVQQGQTLNDNDHRQILIGQRTAEILEVHVGDKVVITAKPKGDGDVRQELFRIKGIFSFGTRRMDQSFAFVTLKDAQWFFELGDDIHEVVLSFPHPNDALIKDTPLWTALRENPNEVLDWKSLLPGLSSILDMSNLSLAIMGGIVFLIVSLGLINSLFMAIYERMFEFGVLKAIGTRPTAIAQMIVTEAGILGFFSCLIGILIGGIGNYYFFIHGFDFSGMEYAGASIRDPIKTVVRWQQYVVLPFYCLGLTLFASLYPAIHAARLIPSKAMRKSL